ncbi:MAG: hypothetical protein IIY21_04750 [Clostridiales bacterium]|jgi:hypothetical protein|nr:hypothetical protein [Clostridiales bacterium]MBR3245320.1 hypothetical protein [Parasporobacterium sp.]
MVKGIDRFKAYFRDYTDQYVLIGGAACDISFGSNNAEFRATRDLDVVLIAEALTREFGQRFWEFIRDGGYQNRAKSSGASQFYRFDKPTQEGFPAMIELFARTEYILEDGAELTPIHIDDSISSLSAILLNDSYYDALLRGRDVIDGFSILRHSWLIPFKAKAWLDLNERNRRGEHVDSRNLKKHRNDIIRMAAELVLERCELPEEVKSDMANFIEEMNVTDQEIRNLKLRGVKAEDIRRLLTDMYL